MNVRTDKRKFGEIPYGGVFERSGKYYLKLDQLGIGCKGADLESGNVVSFAHGEEVTYRPAAYLGFRNDM